MDRAEFPTGEDDAGGEEGDGYDGFENNVEGEFVWVVRGVRGGASLGGRAGGVEVGVFVGGVDAGKGILAIAAWEVG